MAKIASTATTIQTIGGNLVAGAGVNAPIVSFVARTAAKSVNGVEFTTDSGKTYELQLPALATSNTFTILKWDGTAYGAPTYYGRDNVATFLRDLAICQMNDAHHI